jgi:hypothetical protein
MTTPEVLAHLAAPWAKLYSDSRTAATIVNFLHIAPVVVGGGNAIALRAVAHDMSCLDAQPVPARASTSLVKR